MSESNSVKISIGNRTYPIRISKDEEAKLLQAAQSINKRLKELEENYAVKDKQDLLSMCVLQYATEAEVHHKQSDKKENKVDEVTEQVDNLKTLIDDYLASQEVSS